MPTPREAQPATILVVEDDDAVCRLVARVLRHAGYTVHTASTVASARHTLGRTPPGGIDLVIADLVVPDGFGAAIVEEARKTNPDAAVLFITGHDPGERTPAWRPAAGDYVLYKPFTPDDLLCVASQLLGRRRSPEEVRRGPR